MRKLILSALILGIISAASFILKIQYDKTPLSLAKAILENPEPTSKIEVFYSKEIEINKNELTFESVQLLTKLSNYLKETGFKHITIQGHTDKSFPEPKNRVLSFETANAVKFHFTNNLRLSPSLFKTRGMGSSDPLPGTKPENMVVIAIRR